MFSEAPIGSAPLSSGGGTTWLASLTEGAGGWAAATGAATLGAQVQEGGQAQAAQAVAFTSFLLATEGATALHVQGALSVFLLAVAEAPAATDNAAVTTTWVASRSEGVGVTAEGFQAAHVNYSNIDEGALAVDAAAMTQFWEFISTGVNAGWGMIPTGTGVGWTLIKTRKD